MNTMGANWPTPLCILESTDNLLYNVGFVASPTFPFLCAYPDAVLFSDGKAGLLEKNAHIQKNKFKISVAVHKKNENKNRFVP